MLCTQRLAVMSVVGFNTGGDSAQWQEVKYCAPMLSAAVSAGLILLFKQSTIVRPDRTRLQTVSSRASDTAEVFNSA